MNKEEKDTPTHEVLDGRPGWRGFAAVPLLKKMQEQMDRLREPGDDDDVPAPSRFGQESGT
jgi:hypothetical protein